MSAIRHCASAASLDMPSCAMLFGVIFCQPKQCTASVIGTSDSAMAPIGPSDTVIDELAIVSVIGNTVWQELREVFSYRQHNEIENERFGTICNTYRWHGFASAQ
eukprot:s3271_g1.t1